MILVLEFILRKKYIKKSSQDVSIEYIFNTCECFKILKKNNYYNYNLYPAYIRFILLSIKFYIWTNKNVLFQATSGLLGKFIFQTISSCRSLLYRNYCRLYLSYSSKTQVFKGGFNTNFSAELYKVCWVRFTFLLSLLIKIWNFTFISHVINKYARNIESGNLS